MKILHFSDKFIEKNPHIHELIYEKLYYSLISYMLDSKTRKAVRLRFWLKKQFKKVPKQLTNLAKKVPDSPDMDVRAIYALKVIHSHMMYVGDYAQWGYNEKWQTLTESLKSFKGDCEDGAILLYGLLRTVGVPANRLVLFAGDVFDPHTKKMGGHCWLGYKPTNFPLNYVFLDWCYYYSGKWLTQRPLYHIPGKNIFEMVPKKGTYKFNPKSKYKGIWFAFNEDWSASRIKRRRRK